MFKKTSGTLPNYPDDIYYFFELSLQSSPARMPFFHMAMTSFIYLNTSVRIDTDYQRVGSYLAQLSTDEFTQCLQRLHYMRLIPTPELGALFQQFLTKHNHSSTVSAQLYGYFAPSLEGQPTYLLLSILSNDNFSGLCCERLMDANNPQVWQGLKDMLAPIHQPMVDYAYYKNALNVLIAVHLGWHWMCSESSKCCKESCEVQFYFIFTLVFSMISILCSPTLLAAMPLYLAKVKPLTEQIEGVIAIPEDGDLLTLATHYQTLDEFFSLPNLTVQRAWRAKRLLQVNLNCIDRIEDQQISYLLAHGETFHTTFFQLDEPSRCELLKKMQGKAFDPQFNPIPFIALLTPLQIITFLDSTFTYLVKSPLDWGQILNHLPQLLFTGYPAFAASYAIKINELLDKYKWSLAMFIDLLTPNIQPLALGSTALGKIETNKNLGNLTVLFPLVYQREALTENIVKAILKSAAYKDPEHQVDQLLQRLSVNQVRGFIIQCSESIKQKPAVALKIARLRAHEPVIARLFFTHLFTDLSHDFWHTHWPLLMASLDESSFFSANSSALLDIPAPISQTILQFIERVYPQLTSYAEHHERDSALRNRLIPYQDRMATLSQQRRQYSFIGFLLRQSWYGLAALSILGSTPSNSIQLRRNEGVKQQLSADIHAQQPDLPNVNLYGLFKNTPIIQRCFKPAESHVDSPEP